MCLLHEELNENSTGLKIALRIALCPLRVSYLTLQLARCFSAEGKIFFFFFNLLEIWGKNDGYSFVLPMPLLLANSPIKMTGVHHQARHLVRDGGKGENSCIIVPKVEFVIFSRSGFA